MKDSIHQIDPILVAGEAYSDLEYIANEDGRTTRTYIGIMAGFGDLVYQQAARVNELKENLKLQLQQLAMRAAMRQGILANGSTDQLTPQFKSDVVREHLRQYDMGRALFATCVRLRFLKMTMSRYQSPRPKPSTSCAKSQ